MDNNCEDSVCPVVEQNSDMSIENGYLLIGDHENQVTEGGEADLHKHKKNCKKNPGHPEFIPVESFSLKHLPEGHQDSDLYELIKATADLTVKLSVSMTSPDRPEFWPNTKSPYPNFNLRGKKILSTGSGRVWRVIKKGDEDKSIKCTPCPCDKCAASDLPSNVWLEIYVETAAHVVFDEVEANHTKLRVFYDREDSELIIVKDKVWVYDVIVGQDLCQFTCVSCDKTLGHELQKMWKHYFDVWTKVYDKYSKSRDIHKLNFIVSHPHGCSKQVSVGQWKDKVQVGDDVDNHKFTYTTCTCPGSSGASVHCVGYSWCEQVHSGSFKSGLNFSTVGIV